MADPKLPPPPGTVQIDGIAEQAVRRSLARQQAYANILDSTDAPSARQARILSRDLDIPASAVGADLIGFRQERDNRDALSALNDVHISTFVANPSNGAAVKDDLPALSEMSAIVRLSDESRDKNLIHNYMKRSAQSSGLVSALTLLPTAQERSLGPVDVSRAINTRMPAPARERINGIRALDASVTGMVVGASRGAETFLADAIGMGDTYRGSDYYKQTGETVRQLNFEAQEPIRRLEESSLPDSIKWTGARVYEATQSIALLGAAIGSGNPIMAFGLGTGAEQYNRVRTRGGTANEALVSGAVTGTAEGVFEKYLGLGWMLGNFGKKATSKFIGGLLLREVPSEMATTAVQNAADALVTGGQGWESYKKNLPQDLLNTAASTALMVGALGGANAVARRLQPEQRSLEEIGRAAAGGEFVDRLMAAAEKSKARKEDPETIREFVEQRTEATPVRSIYVPVEAVAEYMQSEGYDGSLDRYQDQIAEAQATQGDVVIPVADAVAYLAGTPTWEALREQARVEPGGLSRKEAQEKHADIIKVLEQRGKEIAAEAQDADTAASAGVEVYNDVKNRLRIAGIDDKQADAVAQIYAARYEARAGRMGGTAIEQYRKSKISFPGETPGQYSDSREVAQEAVVNIGLDIPGGGRLEESEALKELEALGVEITDSEVRQSSSEPTLIARLSRALTPEEGTKLSETLRQEAIAQRVGEGGDLFGPMADKWGPFNPDFFLDPTERTLNQDAALVGHEGALRYLTDEKKDGLRANSKAKILRLLETLPDAREMAAAAQAGRAKRGWYEESALAILEVFGAADAPRFAALLAATSPQTSVESNLYNALKIWTNWNDAGRPTDRKQIIQIMGSSVMGNKGVESVLTAWINNSVTALTAPDVHGITLSGPKVNSFMNNLVGVVDEVTNDAWMANYAAVDPTFVRSVNGKKGPGYKAMSAVVRRAADILTKKTGQLWTPAEVQETVWSFAKTVYEMRDKAGEERTMAELLKAGHVTHADIANTPDFAVLFTDGVFRTILEKGGYSVDALEGRGRSIDVDGNAPISDAEGTGFSQRDFDKFLTRAATRLESVRTARRTQSRVLNQDVLPEAGWTPERVSGLIDQYAQDDGSSTAIAVMMSPDEFLRMTASEEGIAVIRERAAAMGPFDPEVYARSGTVGLTVALGGENDTRPPPMIRGHEGRHRMAMAAAAGIREVPVLVSLTDKDGKPHAVKKPLRVQNILGNRSRANPLETSRVADGVVEGVPVAWRFKEELQGLNDRVLYQSDEEVFYSAAQRVVEASQQKKATAAQWKALLSPGKTPGIKAEEIEWTGIHDWLDMQQGPIEKDALLQVLRDRGIKVEEVLLGETASLREQGIQRIMDDLDTDRATAEYTFDNDTDQQFEIDEAGRRPQFQSWSSDPENNSYRELLITLPVGQGSNPDRAPSTHWDTEGVVAHVRFMEKTDAEGKRVLFLEEIQSDWHQKGRDQGYGAGISEEEAKARHATAIEASAKVRETAAALADAYAKYAPSDKAEVNDRQRMQYGAGYAASQAIENADDETKEKLSAEIAAFNEAFLREREAQANVRKINEGIPDAPFKTSWPALVMKRAIRWAVDNGFERVAWTTGEEQAERYNLSRSTGPIRIRRDQSAVAQALDEKRYIVQVNKSAADIIKQNYSISAYDGTLDMSAEQVTEVFGRDLGGRLLTAAEDEKLLSLQDFAVFDKDDLRVGGEGMKAFYDRNLVNITNDIIKKYGAKVGPIVLPKDATDVSPRMREAYGMPEPTPNPGFDITEKMAEAARGGFTLFQEQKGPRGSTTITGDGQHIIQLFATANRSTLLHETGHIWLEELKADAAENEDAKRDLEIVEKWWSANGATDFTEQHELWARGIERYFMEGKAPSQQLQGVFRTFRAWLLRIYQVVQNLRTPITPEVREVFDRLLATQEAIDDAHRMNAMEPLFKTAEEAGMTEAEFADYNERISDARDEAYDALLYKTMESIRKAKNAERRSQRAAIRDEVGNEIARQPQYRLLHLLRTGRWLGDPDREPMPVKLNTGWLIDNYGEEILDKLPRGIQIYKGNGLVGDDIAEIVGLASGAEVVQTLLGMRATSDALRARGETRSMRDVMIEEEVDRLMAERHGDTLNDGTIEEEAIAALNTARQGEIIGSEIRQLAKRKSAVGVPTPYQFAREWARRTVAAGNVRDVASRSALQRYTRAANKSARLAEEAILAGDVDEAYRQKQAQLLNHALLAEAKAAADRVDKITARMRKLGGRAAMKSVHPDYMSKIHMLLERYDFRPQSEKAIDEQAGFQAWLEDQRSKGFEVHIPPRLQNQGVPWTRVSVEELESLSDLVESLVHLGRTKQKLVVLGRERDFAEQRDEIVARIKQLPDRKAKPMKWWVKGKLRNASPINEEERWGAQAAAELLKVETIVEELDGGVTGPLHDILIVGSTNAENKRYELRERVLKPLAQLYHQMSGKQRRRLQERVTIPELTWNTLNEGDPRLGDPVTMTRMELLSVFLNMGNLSNLEKLSKGERWPVATLQAVVNRELTKEDMDFAQLLWDQVDALWPDIVRVEGALSGVVPEKVIENEIQTAHGAYKGGYWPVVYDAARWQLAEDMEGKEADDMFGIKSGVATQKGHTISRTAAFGPFNLNLENVLFRHIEQVATRIAFAEYARDVLRVIKDKQIRGWIDTKLGPEYRKQIEKWLGRQIHDGSVNAKAARWWDHVFRQARINVTIAAMGLRFSTGVAQTLGLTASAQRIGAKWVGVGMKRMAQNPAAASRFAYARSPELLHRTEAVNREVAELNAKLRGKHSWWTNAQSWAMWHIGMIDRYMVALPTWMGAYAKGEAQGMTDEEASHFADKSVRLSQGAGREKDLSPIQSLANGNAMKFFTMFYTPFNVMFNAQWQGIRGLKKGDVKPMIGVTFWWMMASTLGDAFLAGDWPDEEDDNGWIKWFGRNVFFGMFAGIPLARDVANTVERESIGAYASDPGTTPLARIYEAGDKAFKQGSKLADGEEIENPIKQGGDLTAVLLGLPTSQVGTTAQFAWNVHEGETEPQDFSDWYFGVTRGKVPSEEERR